MKKTRLWIVLAILAAASLACSLGTLGRSPTLTPEDQVSAPTEETVPTEEAAPTEDTQPGDDTGSENGNSFDTEFPIPDDATNFFKLGKDVVNYQTTMSLDDVMEFYRKAFDKEGYKERDLLTVTSDSTFSMVFDGHKSGNAIVIQGVDLGDGNTNVNIRLEPVN